MLELFKQLNTLEDVEKFIQATSADTDAQSRENITIEYKEAHQKFSNTNEVGKDVSAFANSEGGLIFYGIACDNNDKTKPIRISGLHHPNIESLDRIINSHIHYPIKGIQKKLIPPNGDPKVMLLYIPQSDESPHQNGDQKYYIRLGTESRPMPHYLVELHFGKRRKPKLSINFEKLPKPDTCHAEPWSERLNLHLSLINSGNGIAKYVRVIFLFPQSDQYLKSSDQGHFSHDRRYTLLSNYSPGNRAWEFKDYQDVVHPRASIEIGNVLLNYQHELICDPEIEEKNPVFEWEAFAEEMEPQKGKVILTSLFS